MPSIALDCSHRIGFVHLCSIRANIECVIPCISKLVVVDASDDNHYGDADMLSYHCVGVPANAVDSADIT